jgi:hypothetical protein
MKTRFFIMLIAMTALASLASAGISCPCSRPGKPGTPIDFDCSIGEAVNLSFFVQDNPTLGEQFDLWAVKDLEGGQIPAKNLLVTVSRGDILVLNLVSDENGYLGFLVDKPGDYSICGGDASYNFTIDGTASNDNDDSPPAEDESGTMPEETDTNPEDDTVGTDVQNNPQQESVVATPKKSKESGGTDWTYVIVPVVGLAAIMLIWKKDKWL